MMENFNQIWENDIYGQGKHLNRYPFDNVVSFLFRYYPRNKPKNEVKILEVGCGAGNNLWFAAREGFKVVGIDGSRSAIDFCKKRFQDEGLEGTFVVGDFTQLPFEDNYFDILIDRGSIVCVDLEAGKRAVQEAYRTLQKGGYFFFNPYSQMHSSFVGGELLPNGYTTNIQSGSLIGVGDLCFYSYRDILDTLPKNKWNIKSIKHKEFTEMNTCQSVHAEWEIIAEKI